MSYRIMNLIEYNSIYDRETGEMPVRYRHCKRNELQVRYLDTVWEPLNELLSTTIIIAKTGCLETVLF